MNFNCKIWDKPLVPTQATHFMGVYFFSVSTLLLMAYMAYSDKKFNWVIIPLAAFNIIFQIHFFQMHISPYLGNMTD